MIVNMPVNGPNNSSAAQPHSTEHSSHTSSHHNNNNNNNNNNSLPSNCEFNFLKRKYETQLEEPYEQLNANPWKKRHLDYDVNGVGVAPGVGVGVGVGVGAAGDLCFQLQLDTSASGTASAAFINDLFAYDNQLLVPAASYCAPPAAPLEADAGGWQAGELLELDHRYTTGLQTEISQLNATLPPMQNQPDSQLDGQQAEQQLQLPATGNGFLVPIAQKQQQQQQQPQSQSQSQSQPTAQSQSRSCPARSSPEPDFEDKNLSWLLNFKFDEFPHLSPDVGGGMARLGVGLEAATPTAATTAHMASASPCSSASPASASNSSHSHSSQLEPRGSPKSCSNSSSTAAAAATTPAAAAGGVTGAAAATATPTKTGRKFEELVMEVTSEMDGNDMIVAEHVVVEDTASKA
ncbi:hypothetical protein AWZ03_014455 [Drosophila navojoa]|uniref:Uncharacterized protein n=2 Tax=Drosophila navojoa TaxID=7232 RepID=A0A484ARX1_DRONA|nr:hypothetical protein AWZ03_014455 [Drosophila navojoa]